MQYSTVQPKAIYSIGQCTAHNMDNTALDTSIYSTAHSTHTGSRQYYSLSQMRPAGVFLENAATSVCVLCLYVSLRYGTVRYGMGCVRKW